MKHPSTPSKSPKKERPVQLHEYRFELMVEGMMCIRCTKKVEKALTENNNLSITNLKVDFITNRVLFTVDEKKHVETAIQKLEEVGFYVKSSRDVSSTLAGNMRILTLNILKGSKEIIINTLSRQEKPLIEEELRIIKNKCTIVYNPVNIRGSEIIRKLQETIEFKNGAFLFTIENPFEEDVDQIKFSEFNGKQLVTVVTISILNVLLSFLHGKYMTWPHGSGMFSFYMITIFSLTMLNLKCVGYGVYSTCIKQFKSSSNINMLTLVSIGSGLALFFGFLYIFMGIIEMIFSEGIYSHFFIMNSTHMFETSTTILTALVVGKYIEGKIKKRIYSKVNDLKNKLRIKVDGIRRIVPKNKKFEALSTENLAPLLIEKDDYIEIQNQGMIPFDGFVEKGTLKVVENIQYGWEKVETKTKGHPIISGTQVIEAEEGTIMRVTEPLEKTLAGRLFYEIKEAASGSSSEQNKGTDILASITKYFVSTVIVAAVLTFMGWSFRLFTGIGDISYSYPFEKVISVLVASCPCALGIAIPMVYAIALRKGFKSGALIKDTSSLDILQTIDTVIFDKTGTITGTYSVKEVEKVTNKYDDASLWEMVSILEKDHLQHPVGLALFQEALQKLSSLNKPEHVIIRDEQDKSLHEYYASEGVIEKGLFIDNKQVRVVLGNEKLLQRLGINSSNPEMTPEDLEADEKDIHIDLFLCIENQVHLRLCLSLQENLKSNAAKLISELQKDFKEVYILSGDNHTNALQIGQKVGIPSTHIKAEMDPEAKEKFINYLIENEKKKVLMVGDGINDIKAFKAATLSCSINFKSSQNLTFADFIITNNNLDAISGLFRLSSITSQFKTGILFCALIYNVPVILTASGALKVTFGIDLAAYFACWTMIIFSLFLTAVANLMELVNIQESHKVSLLMRLYKRIKLSIQLQKDLYMRKKLKSVSVKTTDKAYSTHIKFFMIPILYFLK